MFNKYSYYDKDINIENESKVKIKHLLDLLNYVHKVSDQHDKQSKVDFNIPDLRDNYIKAKYLNKIKSLSIIKNKTDDLIVKATAKKQLPKTPKLNNAFKSKSNIRSKKLLINLSNATINQSKIDNNNYEIDDQKVNTMFNGVFKEKYPINRDIHRPLKDRLIRVLQPDFNFSTIKAYNIVNMRSKSSTNKESKPNLLKTCHNFKINLSRIKEEKIIKPFKTKTTSNKTSINNKNKLYSGRSLSNLLSPINNEISEYNKNRPDSIDSLFTSKMHLNYYDEYENLKPSKNKKESYDSIIKPNHKSSTETIYRKISQTMIKSKYEQFNLMRMQKEQKKLV